MKITTGGSSRSSRVRRRMRVIAERTGRTMRGLLKTGMREEMAILAVARKLSATVLAVWKSGESFDAGRILRKAV